MLNTCDYGFEKQLEEKPNSSEYKKLKVGFVIRKAVRARLAL